MARPSPVNPALLDDPHVAAGVGLTDDGDIAFRCRDCSDGFYEIICPDGVDWAYWHCVTCDATFGMRNTDND